MVPKRLKEARELVGLSQSELAELIGIDGVSTRSRLSNYEVGRFSPPFSIVVKIAQILDYPEYYFYTLDDDLAKNLLEMHRKRMNPKENSFHSSVIEEKRLTEKINEAKKKINEIIDILEK